MCGRIVLQSSSQAALAGNGKGYFWLKPSNVELFSHKYIISKYFTIYPTKKNIFSTIQRTIVDLMHAVTESVSQLARRRAAEEREKKHLCWRERERERERSVISVCTYITSMMKLSWEGHLHLHSDSCIMAICTCACEIINWWRNSLTNLTDRYACHDQLYVYVHCSLLENRL